MANKKLLPAYQVAKDKVNKYREKHPGTSVSEACRICGVSTTNYYFKPHLRKIAEANRVSQSGSGKTKRSYSRTGKFEGVAERRKQRRRKQPDIQMHYNATIDPGTTMWAKEQTKDHTVVALVGNVDSVCETIKKIFQ